MDILTVVLIAALVILALSLLLYLVGFRWKKLTFKWVFGEAELEREPAGAICLQGLGRVGTPGERQC